MERKRRRGDEEPVQDEGIEQRLVNLIVRVGDKNIESLNAHLDGLAKALEDDLAVHRTLIIDTIFDCVRSLQTKTSVYGTLVGLLNAYDDAFGAAIATNAHRELQQALDDHAPNAIRGLTRFVIELVNARSLAPSASIELLEMFIDVRKEPEVPQARSDWFCLVALDAVSVGGKFLSTAVPAELTAVIASVRDYMSGREPLRSAAPLLMPYSEATEGEVSASPATCLPCVVLHLACACYHPPHRASALPLLLPMRPSQPHLCTRALQVVEHVDALWKLVCTFEADGGWSSPCLLTPHRAFASEVCGGIRMADRDGGIEVVGSAWQLGVAGSGWQDRGGKV